MLYKVSIAVPSDIKLIFYVVRITVLIKVFTWVMGTYLLIKILK